MALIRNRADLILAAVRLDNPQLSQQLSLGNCSVYRYGNFSKSKGFCTVKGRYGTGVRDKVIVKYNKLDVAVLLAGIDAMVNFTGATTTKDLLPAFNTRYGFDLTVADIVDKPLESGGTVARLELANSSTLYRGTTTFKVFPALPTLSAVVGQRQLDPVLQYWPVQSGFNGSMVSIGHDYTILGQQLVGLQAGVLSDTQAVTLASWLSAVDANPWVGHGPANYSLKEATVVYNGPVEALPANYSPLLRALFNHILVVTPSPIQNTNMGSAPIAFHYNVF